MGHRRSLRDSFLRLLVVLGSQWNLLLRQEEVNESTTAISSRSTSTAVLHFQALIPLIYSNFECRRFGCRQLQPAGGCAVCLFGRKKEKELLKKNDSNQICIILSIESSRLPCYYDLYLDLCLDLIFRWWRLGNNLAKQFRGTGHGCV